MSLSWCRLALGLALVGSTMSASGFSLTIDADSLDVGDVPISSSCSQQNGGAFTSDGSRTFITGRDSYSGNKALELNVVEGLKGFGSLGGIINFENCDEFGGRKLVHGDEVWVRVRLKFPEGFEFNRNGSNKFLRLRTFHDEGGTAVSEGYNDLYINAPPGQKPWGVDDCFVCGDASPFMYIFEGRQKWYKAGLYDEHFFEPDTWHTVEYYLKLDNLRESEGGESRVRVWFDGELIGDTGERATLLTPESYISSLYFFTYWDNDGAHLSQKFYADDLTITTNRPSNSDEYMNPFIGADDVSTRNSPRLGEATKVIE